MFTVAAGVRTLDNTGECEQRLQVRPDKINASFFCLVPESQAFLVQVVHSSIVGDHDSASGVFANNRTQG